VILDFSRSLINDSLPRKNAYFHTFAFIGEGIVTVQQYFATLPRP